MVRYLVAMALIGILMSCWIAVQRYSKVFARRHPEFGPAREEGGGCGSGGECRCAGGEGCRRGGEAAHKSETG